MTTKNKTIDVLGLMFVAVISLLIFAIIKKFDILDFMYLLFIIGCFIRYIYIKRH